MPENSMTRIPQIFTDLIREIRVSKNAGQKLDGKTMSQARNGMGSWLFW
jgi:hypothetical protein